MWALEQIHVGLVFGGMCRSKAMIRVCSMDFGNGEQWWPCVLGADVLPFPREELRAVLCEPLLDMNCKKPWLTHTSRLLWPSMPTQTPAPWKESSVIIEEVVSSDGEVDPWQNWRKLSTEEFRECEIEMMDSRQSD